MPKLYANQYIDESIARGSYKYDLSIIVTGYNKLEYTRQCVSSVLANIPSGVKYELILFNHGSSDGTKEYFESINPAKQIDVKINGSIHDAHFRIVEGEYLLCISNDTIITKNAIDNMLRSMREHEDYGWMVPTTPNVSNLQTIPCDFTDIGEMLAFAECNNVYDPYRHEVRTRLCNPISFFRSSTALSSDGVNFTGCHFTGGNAQIMSFPDDTMSMLFRRRGLKSILAKDAFCFHFGSVTIKDDVGRKNIDEAAGYARGRLEFKNAFGIDPWGTGFCYD
jgi:hypothetical protein